jgi:hypothetical protein
MAVERGDLLGELGFAVAKDAPGFGAHAIGGILTDLTKWGRRIFDRMNRGLFQPSKQLA